MPAFSSLEPKGCRLQSKLADPLGWGAASRQPAPMGWTLSSSRWTEAGDGLLVELLSSPGMPTTFAEAYRTRVALYQQDRANRY
jgi:hypothetical protein